MALALKEPSRSACQIPGHIAWDMRVPMPSRGVMGSACGTFSGAALP